MSNQQFNISMKFTIIYLPFWVLTLFLINLEKLVSFNVDQKRIAELIAFSATNNGA
jgi:hypothetical protein